MANNDDLIKTKLSIQHNGSDDVEPIDSDT